jgi:hypothetical protein
MLGFLSCVRKLLLSKWLSENARFDLADVVEKRISNTAHVSARSNRRYCETAAMIPSIDSEKSAAVYF